ncbi:hypothetical protein BaRGS_00036099, partial [Batillaria attramentaria]
ESSYVHDFTDVYTMATNTNFYKQVVPNETCDVIITSFATHWLEDPVPPLRSSVFDVTATEEELLPFQRASARCWEKFLLLRAKELKPGGLLIAMTLAADGTFGGTEEIIFDLQDSWRELMEKSVITQAMWREKRQREGIDDRECFAARLAEAHRVWSNASFRSGLSDSRKEEEKDAVLDQLYDTVRRKIAQSDPDKYR